MNRSLIPVLLVAAGPLLPAAPVGAHHSFAAVFDETKPVSVTVS